MQRSLPNFSSMLGFGIDSGGVVVPNGFCGGIALLGAVNHRPSVTSRGFTLNQAGAAHLYTYMRNHYFKDPSDGHEKPMCDANGAQTIYSNWACMSQIATGTHKLYDYAHFNQDQFHQDLKDYAGHYAIVVEWADGGAFPGNEPGVRYHFSTCGAIDTVRYVEGLVGGYAWCDDDNNANLRPAQPNPPIWHDWPTVVNAHAIAYYIAEFGS